jgi:hypothetical protein
MPAEPVELIFAQALVIESREEDRFRRLGNDLHKVSFHASEACVSACNANHAPIGDRDRTMYRRQRESAIRRHLVQIHEALTRIERDLV